MSPRQTAVGLLRQLSQQIISSSSSVSIHRHLAFSHSSIASTSAASVSNAPCNFPIWMLETAGTRTQLTQQPFINQARSMWSSPWVHAPRQRGTEQQQQQQQQQQQEQVAQEQQQQQQPSTSTATQGQQAANSAGQAVHSPLQSLLDAAIPSRVQGDSGRTALGTAVPRVQRSWAWFDERDEREEQARERRGLVERYKDAGFAKRINAEQSMKKLDRVLKLVRGLPYQEAVHQCRLQPLKAARIVLECLEKAYEDAATKGLDQQRLVVATIFSTKGAFEKGIIPMGKGFMARKLTRKSHITVALREAEEGRRSRAALAAAIVGPVGRGRKAPRGLEFGARVVSPVMARRVRTRPRFAYVSEV